MATKKTLYFVVNGSSYSITSSADIYDKKDVTTIIGGLDKPSGSVVSQSEIVKRTLVQLAATFKDGTKTGSLRFYCDPSKVEDALAKLPGKKITNTRELVRVYRPLRRCYV